MRAPSISRVLEEQPGDSPEPVFSFLGPARHASAAAALLDHAHQRAHARDHPRRPRSLADVHRRHPGRRAALLPLDRGQDPSLRRQGKPPDLPRARRADAATRSIRTASRPACRSTCSSSWCARSAGSSTRTSCAPAMRSSTTTSIRATCVLRSRPRAIARAVLRRPDQRHDRLRGSRRARPARRPERRAAGSERAAGARAATRRTSACWSTT